jgi:hypothetical protein
MRQLNTIHILTNSGSNQQTYKLPTCLIKNKPTNSLPLHSWVVKPSAAEALDSLQSQKVHYHVHKSQILVSILSHMNPVNSDTSKLIYSTYFHSLMKYGIIWGGNSSDSKRVFTLQKKIVRIIVGTKPQTHCRDLFTKLQILLLPHEYIFSLLTFVINNLKHFQTSSAIHCVKTRNKHHLHRSIANMTCFQKKHKLFWHQNFQ